MPAATALSPSRTIACASTQAVVVPSPATSLVFWAASRTICAPMFSNLSSSSISLATVTPSLVVRGAPNDLSMMTLRPLGPSVTFTALASVSTPRSMRSRASAENLTSLAAIVGLTPAILGIVTSVQWRVSGQSRASAQRRAPPGPALPLGSDLLEDPHDVALLHDEELLAVDLDLGAGPLAEQHLVLALTSSGTILPHSSRAPGPTAMISPCWGFSAAVSGMMMPPAVLVSLSTRRTTTRSCRGRNFIWKSSPISEVYGPWSRARSGFG